ncbi:putative serine/threonine-protein kinase-like protein CCR3 [Diospyros lotus]|uniref:putative serine/threonine-protein kinase-like protein CCR3 n=1 Tax=Diospyros lotus TaxID=55363 RepID=UPI002259B8DA|nr:putative serine/threonine-protein kinase-like protein CCR3 [Diospyros lotus]
MATLIVATAIITLIALVSPVHGLGGSAATAAVVYGSATVCGIVAEKRNRRIQCWRNGQVIHIEPDISFDYIAGGRDSFCGVRSGGVSLLCWNSNFTPKRIYNDDSVLLEDLTLGDDQICALTNGTRSVKCWRGNQSSSTWPPFSSAQFLSISSGLGFSCGVVMNTAKVACWGSNTIMANLIQSQFANLSMLSIVAGGSHACGLNLTGFLICKGRNDSGQLDFPSNNGNEFSGMALGANHSCAIRRSNGSVVCWGGAGEFSSNVIDQISFDSIVAGLDFTCGLTISNFSMICWGPGWKNNSSRTELGLSKILPGPCVQSPCNDCGIYPESQILCSGSGNICAPCNPPFSLRPISPPPLQPPPAATSKPLTKGLLALAIVGSVGAVSGICTVIYLIWTGVCCGNKKIHNSVQPTVTVSNPSPAQVPGNNPPPGVKRQGSRPMRRQRSGTSSKHADMAEEFSFSDLATATGNFSPNNKIGAGSFGVVYRGKLWDGREVAIKRGDTVEKTKKFQEKVSAFESELAFLSRLHHKHLVRLVGFCEERDERLLVYEFMKNGALFDHLHDKNNVDESSSLVNSWKMRIKIALDAARGIEYLHNYAVPQIIHRDIKSSNILLDGNWMARVSDFGLSLMCPGSSRHYQPVKTAGTVGYIDPEYYGLNVLTTKSDVYGLGVVMLEILTGKRAIFQGGEDGGEPTSVVDFAVPAIKAGEMGRILDRRVGPPEMNEAEGVELVANTAVHCVNVEGKNRPTMSGIVANLERALALCDGRHGSVSGAQPQSQISIVSD